MDRRAGEQETELVWYSSDAARNKISPMRAHFVSRAECVRLAGVWSARASMQAAGSDPITGGWFADKRDCSAPQ
jgi:hypothetical protein